MLQPDQLTRIVDLHQKSYNLLMWVREQLDANTLDFTATHEAMSASEAARDWVSRNLEHLPEDIRPNRGDLDEFSHLFSSFLVTSFELIESPNSQLYSSCGCYCPMCAYLTAGDRLKTRKIKKKAPAEALAMKRLYLQSLCKELNVKDGPRSVDQVLADNHLRLDLAKATYATELLRRSKFISQGEGSLVLWREFAWKDGAKPLKNFILSADDLITAEQKVVQFLKAA